MMNGQKQSKLVNFESGVKQTNEGVFLIYGESLLFSADLLHLSLKNIEAFSLLSYFIHLSYGSFSRDTYKIV